ncbi:unnamed protein product [Allacma fusca]|uniref:Uncharacterized protein n=1 Tax=Allacma fusca TaxID=39272 RepID=A0A8J2PMA1_9HEXA|nr:unnamed protein product [Allacma fusca]
MLLANIPQPAGVLSMTAERCAYLSLVAMANRLNESWIARLPTVPAVYLYTYFPLLGDLFFSLVGSRMINAMREQKLNAKRK